MIVNKYREGKAKRTKNWSEKSLKLYAKSVEVMTKKRKGSNSFEKLRKVL